jgi:indole-3-glycerol phosphate synthase
MTDKNVLHNIAARTEERVALWKKERPENSLAEGALYARKPLSLIKALGGQGPRVIAEVKFASPSGGFLRKPGSASPAEAARIASAYHDAGAAAISILTEPEYFSGDPSYLTAARAALPGATLLMKDFFIDVYQLELARACGADAVLLIAALLGPRLHEMLFAARARGLSTLVEVHDEAEAEAASSASIIATCALFTPISRSHAAWLRLRPRPPRPSPRAGCARARRSTSSWSSATKVS